ncbi:MAG: hypothetical protein IPP49_10685 [Saprospiraceae bacterium]|nr:hypothetical protein [Saprospiraceae bacterium]
MRWDSITGQPADGVFIINVITVLMGSDQDLLHFGSVSVGDDSDCCGLF